VKRISFTLLLFLVTAVGAHAQGATIHATSRLYDDGTRSNTVVDSEKRTAEETLEDARGKVLRKVTYLMDDGNQYIGSITYDPKGNIVFRTAYKYDGFGRRRVYAYGPQNKLTNVTEYDAAGNAMVSHRRSGTATPAPARRGKK
jgi:hypothetical protein